MKWEHIVSKFIPSGMTVPILKGPLRGAKWIVGAAAGSGKGLSVVLNLSEPEGVDMAIKLTPRDGICFDIGANVGFYTLLFSRRSKHVFAFEPLPRNIAYLWRTLKVNGVTNATIIPCAVSRATQLMRFEERASHAIGHLDNTGRLPVVAISIDDFVSAYQIIPSILKIDVEGAEMFVLEGAARLMAKHRPPLLLSTHGEAPRNKCLGFCMAMKYSQIIPLSKEETDFAIIP
jgi:FkbM family methyltransferase